MGECWWDFLGKFAEITRNSQEIIEDHGRFKKLEKSKEIRYVLSQKEIT